jgi:hypothetical protein
MSRKDRFWRKRHGVRLHPAKRICSNKRIAKHFEVSRKAGRRSFIVHKNTHKPTHSTKIHVIFASDTYYRGFSGDGISAVKFHFFDKSWARVRPKQWYGLRYACAEVHYYHVLTVCTWPQSFARHACHFLTITNFA